MSFPAWTEEVALLRRYDCQQPAGGMTLSDETLLGVLRDLRPKLLMQERSSVLKAYRTRHGVPTVKPTPSDFGDDPAVVADWLCHRQPDTLGLILQQIDPGYGGEILATAMRIFAQHVATTSRGEIHQYSFDEVLLDLVQDARQAPVAGS